MYKSKMSDLALLNYTFSNLLQDSHAIPRECFDFSDLKPLMKESQNISTFINSLDEDKRGASILEVFCIIYQVLKTINRARITHCKINTDTIRIYKGNIFLAAFEHAGYSPYGTSNVNEDIYIYYLDPAALHTKIYNALSELWSLCICLWELATGLEYREFLKRFMISKDKVPTCEDLKIIYQKRNVHKYMIEALPNGESYCRFGDLIRKIFLSKNQEFDQIALEVKAEKSLSIDTSLPPMDFSCRAMSTASTMSMRSNTSMSEPYVKQEDHEEKILKQKWYSVLFDKCRATFGELEEWIKQRIHLIIDDYIEESSSVVYLGERIFAMTALFLRFCGYIFEIAHIELLGKAVVENFDSKQFDEELTQIAHCNKLLKFIY